MADYQATHPIDSGYSLNNGPTNMGNYGPGQYQEYQNAGGSMGTSMYAMADYGTYGDQYRTDINPYANGGEHSYPYSLTNQPEPVTTRTQNYPPDLAVLTQINNRLQALEAKASNDAKTAAQQTQKTDADNRQEELKKKQRRALVQALVRRLSRALLGLGINEAGKRLTDLPHSLKPGEEPDFLADGVTLKAHPDWSGGVSDPVNIAFCIRVKNLVMDKVAKDNLLPQPLFGNPSDTNVMEMVKQYYDTLRKEYKAQNFEEGKVKKTHKRTQGKHRGRKVEKAKDCREAVERFCEIHGEQNTEGAYEAIQTDDMSSEHSDCGNVPKDVFEAHRKRSGGGDNGWEVRRKLWRSGWFNLYLAHLKTIKRQMREEAYQDKNGSSKGKATRVPRFRGLSANNNNSDPAPRRGRKGRKLYEAMVSPEWLKKEGKTYEEVGAVAHPPKLTIFNLQLTKDGLHDTELAYLADDESA
ncbi:hypothetical protein MSAN_00998800 [Mycena sanguinolenta]|uniref:Uncharacterized protein n=1 Tax=Mycena sanguinolenta TaxID=230812 RepID=A0A8H7D6Q8_9AGAR|nr:hypothetical protein MSAN_00998800 [Mycena sanguinolenta]